jgi:MFS family permease
MFASIGDNFHNKVCIILIINIINVHHTSLACTVLMKSINIFFSFQFHLNPEHIGLIFLLFSTMYGVFSLIWGWLADRCNNHWSMMVWGLLICTVGLLLLGPSPLLPFLTK